MTMLPKYSEALRAWLDKEKLSLRKAAELLDVNHNSLRNWLTPGAGIHDSQWEKLKPYISVYLDEESEKSIPDTVRPSYKLLKKVSESDNAEKHLGFIESFLDNYVAANVQPLPKLMKTASLDTITDSIDKNALVQIILPHRDISKDRSAYFLHNESCSLEHFITLETGRAYLPNEVTASFRALILKLIKKGANPYKTIFWRFNEDEDSIKYFRHANSLPYGFTKYCSPIDSVMDKEIIFFWIELIDKVFQDKKNKFLTVSEKAKDLIFKSKNLPKLQVDLIKQTNGSTQKLIEDFYENYS